MITAAQEDYIEQHAYVPEHIPQYVTPISQTEPHSSETILSMQRRAISFSSDIL